MTASTRTLTFTTERGSANALETFTIYQAENVILEFLTTDQHGGLVAMPTDGTCKMEAWASADPDTLYINKVGTVNTTTSKATVELEPAESNITTTGNYLYTVKVFDSAGADMGIIAKGTLTVAYSPDSDAVDYVGTTTYPVAADITYDNTTSELTATDVQAAIDELDAAIDQIEGTITITARNETGVQIDKGSVVYISGSTGNRSTIALATATDGNTAQKTIGVAFANISHNSDGDVVVLGELTGIDLSDFEDGDELYLSETPGGIANTPPAGDADWSYRIGYAETAQNNGKLLVAPQFRGTVYGANFFAATSASGVRTTLDVPSNSEVVLLTPDADTTQDVSPASGFTALRLSADGAFMVLNRTAADTEAVFNFQDEGLGTWQVGLRRDPGNTPNPAPESNAFCVIDTQDASIPFWVSLVDKMVHAVTGLVSPIVKAASASGIAFKDSTGTTQATIDSSGLALTTDLAVTEGGTGASTAQAATYNIHDTRTATMSGDETLTTTSAVYQFLDPDGSDRNLDLPNATMFVVKNTGDGGEVITVRDASDVTIDEVDNGVTLTFRWDGSAWQVMG
jgi:hypothetical protein